MPRFENAHVAFLKRTILPRLPDCLLTKEDINLIIAETSLSEAQIQQYVKHFRARYTTTEEREKFLLDFSRPQVSLLIVLY